MSDSGITDLFNMSTPEKEGLEDLIRKLDLLGIEGPNLCFQCSKCTSGCESMKLLELQPHAVMASAKDGFIEEIMNSDLIWACIGCYKCKERCPQEMSPVELMFIIKNRYVAIGKPVPGDYQTMLQNMISKGFIQDPRDVVDRNNRNNDRNSLRLPEIRGPKDKKHFSEVLSRIAVEEL
ncbi:MAG TPA: hypothetical protein ENK47_03340 [Euryarchaeota archaeon]|nr:hypothetical protein [Euryarchaeota archaeon]